MSLHRREFIKAGLIGGASLFFPGPFLKTAWGRDQSDPHFFLQVFFQGGADNSYLFDARPLEMTKAGKMQNYIGEEPSLWTGVNGQSTYATKLTDPLKPFKNDFSILNGVLMAQQFDGHDQNVNFYFTGNPFGGESFIPHFNLDKAYPVDALQSGFLIAALNNLGSTVPLDVESTKTLVGKLRAADAIDMKNPLTQFIASRMIENSKGAGRFSKGSKNMADAFGQGPSFEELVKNIQIDKDEKEFFPVIREAFKKGLSQSAIISSFTGALDAHDPDNAKKQPKTFEDIVTKIATLFKNLKETPFDSKRSLFDVTTVMVASEFGRTMRQGNKAVDNTGTDHNVLSNSILIGGKGIRGGMVWEPQIIKKVMRFFLALIKL